MEKKQIFEKIETLLPLINKYYESRQVKITTDDAAVLKEVWEKGIMRTTLLTSCSSCVSHAFDVLYSFYHREHPKYLASIEQDKPTKEIVDDIQNELVRQEIEQQKATKKKIKK